MFILGNLLVALASVIGLVLNLYMWIIIARAVISWVNPDPYNPVVLFLQRTTEPILQPIRRFMPPMAIDISPIIAFFAIIFLNIFLVTSIQEFGLRLKSQSQPVQRMDLRSEGSARGQEDNGTFMSR